MPYKNRTKIYLPNIFYHLYARGINRTTIFIERSDYVLFLYLLKKYLTSNFKELKTIGDHQVEFPVNTVSDKILLHCYALMSNHFHLLVKNLETYGINNLMTRILSVYSGYFNKKYKKQGQLIQGSYRGVRMKDDEQYVYVSRYIHFNPVKAGLVKKPYDYPYTSINDYFYKKSLNWLAIDELLLTNTDYTNWQQYIPRIMEDEDNGIIISG